MASSSIEATREAFSGLTVASKRQTDAFFFKLVKSLSVARMAVCTETIPDAIAAEYKHLAADLAADFENLASQENSWTVDRTDKSSACCGGGAPHRTIDNLLKDEEGGNLAFYSELVGFGAFFVNLMTGEYKSVSIKSFKPTTRSAKVMGIDQLSGRCSIVDALAVGEEVEPSIPSFGGFTSEASTIDALESILATLGPPPSGTDGDDGDRGDDCDNNNDSLPPPSTS